MPKHATARWLAATVTLVLAFLLASAEARQLTAQTSVGVMSSEAKSLFRAHALEEIARVGGIAVIIDLHAPGIVEAAASDSEVDAVADLQAAALSSLAGTAFDSVKTYSHLPALALTLHSEAALDALLADPNVAGVVVDRLTFPMLDQTTHLISASATKLLGFEGQDTVIAILDTGVDKNHTRLSGKVISEGCFSTTNPLLSSTSLCPGNAQQSVANNAGLHCTVTGANCYHGTHVAATAAAVAPKAKLIAMQVFSRIVDTVNVKTCANNGRTSPCIASHLSDQLNALNRVYVLKTQSNPINVAAINMSIGGGKYFAPCITAVPSAYASIVSSLRNLRVGTIVSSGNSGHLDAMGVPACLSNVISVGATNDSNQMASFSNISPYTSLLAPGTNVTAATPGNTTATLDGTSMAAPHVAGAFAVLRSVRPSDSAAQIQDALVSTGLPVADQRTGGNVDNKRRINLLAALCSLIACDSDDFRTLQNQVARSGLISPATDRDPYNFYGLAGQRYSIAMERVGGTANPYLELIDPSGANVALNDNGGGGVDALIANHTLQSTGLYQVVARSSGSGTGQYQIVLAEQPAAPVVSSPVLNSLEPQFVTANSTAGSFWVAIKGANFLPTSKVYWDGQVRIMYYSSPSLIYIWVLGSDIGPAPTTPRTAAISVSNSSSPAGASSSAKLFTINPAPLGESELVQPALDSTLDTGVSQTLVLSWTVPVSETTWRIMQNMDLRLRDETGRVMASIRVVERPGADSVYQLLNQVGDPVRDSSDIAIEGIPGMAQDLVISDTITLHMAQTSFLGSGLTAIMSPTVTFGPNAVGKWRVEFRVDKTVDEFGSRVQDEDVLGTITVADPACPFPVSSLQIQGPDSLATGVDAQFTLDIDPVNASQPISVTWSPLPQSGQGATTATLQWQQAGRQIVSVSAENCGRFAANLKEVGVFTLPGVDLDVRANAPSIVQSGSPIAYSFVISNSGALTATNVLVVAELPAATVHQSGGNLVGSEVSWLIPALGGFGATSELTMTVLPLPGQYEAILSTYRAQADGGVSVQGTHSVTTSIVEAVALVEPLLPATLSFGAGDSLSTTLELPAGAVADVTMLGASELGSLPAPLPDGAPPVRQFSLEVHQSNQRQEPFTLTESIRATLAFTDEMQHARATQGEQGAPLLYLWTNSGWTTDGTLCAMESASIAQEDIEKAVCVLAGAHAGTYALVISQGAATHRVYLSTVQGQAEP